jgi:hypothetical protein
VRVEQVVRYYSVAVVPSESAPWTGGVSCKVQIAGAVNRKKVRTTHHPLCNRGIEFGCPALHGGPVESGPPFLQVRRSWSAEGGASDSVRSRSNAVLWRGRGGGLGVPEVDLDS